MRSTLFARSPGSALRAKPGAASTHQLHPLFLRIKSGVIPRYVLSRVLRDRRPFYLALVDGQVDDPGDDAQRNRHVPDQIVAAQPVEQKTSEPGAEKAYDPE